jgi:hypothetical protein
MVVAKGSFRMHISESSEEREHSKSFGEENLLVEV